MNFPRHHQQHHHPRRKHFERPGNPPDIKELANPESTGKESSYLRHLIDSHAKVTVIMKTGEQFQGHIRYYDQDCFSVGLMSEKRKIFLRKENVSYIAEE
jgi:small nuclear ribonucleoprotein (snRNP)-like protein